MTIPTLIGNYQKQQTVVQLRKVYSDLSNAVKLSEVDNGPMSGWVYPTTNDSVISFLEQYWLPYLHVSKVEETNKLNSQGYFILSNGTTEHSAIKHYIILNNGVILSFSFYTPQTAQNGYVWLLADINGMKGPNKRGRDIFVFDAYKTYGSFGVKLWGSGGSSADRNSISGLMNNGVYACNNSNNHVFANFNCGRVIELNDWKIPSNYPR